MENNGFKEFSDIWKKADDIAASQKTYSIDDLNKIKMKTSQDFSRSINNSIVFDFIHKGILIAGMLLLAWFYKTNVSILVVLFILISISVITIIKEYGIRKELVQIDDYTKKLKDVITQKLDFYKDRFVILKLMLAFTNALLVWVGSMFYYYSKYGYYKIEDITDLIVAMIMIGASFGISYLSLTWLLKNNVTDLQVSLNELTENVTQDLQALLRRKRRQKVILAFIAAVGLVLFVLLVSIYLFQLF